MRRKSLPFYLDGLIDKCSFYEDIVNMLVHILTLNQHLLKSSRC